MLHVWLQLMTVAETRSFLKPGIETILCFEACFAIRPTCSDEKYCPALEGWEHRPALREETRLNDML